MTRSNAEADKGLGGQQSRDHMLGKQFMGQQMLEMGLATPKGYVHLDSGIM